MNYDTPEAMLARLGARLVPPPPLQFGRLRVLTMDDIVDAAARDYIVKSLMSPDEVSVWWGPPKCGKSFLMLRIAYLIALGLPVFGRRVHACPVLYMAAEGEAGIAGRLLALKAELGVARNFHLIAQPVDLLHEGGDLEGVKGDLEAVKKAAMDPRIGAKLIIVDTLSRAMAGGDENGPADMGKFIANIGALRSYTDAHIAIIHHGTKNPNASTPRGHSSLIGAADLVVEVARAQDGTRSATVTAAKDDPDGAVMGFTLRVVELGIDQDGDPITTCVADEMDGPLPAKTKIGGSTWRAVRILADVVAAEGTPLPPGNSFPDHLYGVPERRWREECDTRRLSAAQKPDDRQKAFRRACQVLLDEGFVASRDGIVWLARDLTS